MLDEFLGTRYRVIQVLGSGGFGQTYIAEDTQRPGNPRCVLKHLTFASRDPLVLQEVRRLFQAEAETLERLGQHDQIPRLLAYFEQDQEFYLVQEFIQGHPLNQELTTGSRFSEAQVMAVLEDVLGILEFVHSQGVIHRDIKPDNLIRRDLDGRIVLIDFGAVKQLGQTIAETAQATQPVSVPVYTSGYAASEQCMGRPQFNSDLYSLGMVGIQLLTGLRPSQLPHDHQTSEIIWQDQATVSAELATFLIRMTRYHHLERFQTSRQALDALHRIMATSPTVLTGSPGSSEAGEQLRPVSLTRTTPQDQTHTTQTGFRASKKSVLTGLGLATLATAALAFTLQTRTSPISGILSNNSSVPSADTAPARSDAREQERQGNRISLGEKLLNTWQSSPQKQEAIAAFAAGDYARAVRAFEAARRQDQGDPEALIYLNNARIGANPTYKIAVAVPLGDTFSSAMEILRGVAQVQDQVNQSGGIKGKLLQVAIANDDNRRDIAQQLAADLTNDPNLLGVIGHGISDTSLAAASIYQKQGVVMVSPLSSAVQLANIGNYIFRTMPSDRLTAKALANYLLNQLRKQKVVAFYSSASTYSTSLKNEFRDALFYNGVELAGEFDLSRPDFDAADSLDQATARGAQAILLVPGSETSDRALLVLKLNGRKLPVLAGDGLVTPKLLRVAGKDAVGITLAVPSDLTRSPFVQQAQQLWGKSASVTWRTALAYDAAKSLIMAIAVDPTRNGIQRTLTEPNFTVNGSTSSFQFLPSGDIASADSSGREAKVYLMTVAPVKAGLQTRYTLAPLKN